MFQSPRRNFIAMIIFGALAALIHAIIGPGRPTTPGGDLLLYLFSVFVVIVVWSAISITRAALKPAAPPAGGESARTPLTADDLHTMVLYYGVNDPDTPPARGVEAEVRRQIAEETARKQRFASIALASLHQGSKIHVQLHKASPTNELLWRGDIGEIPAGDLPRDDPHSLAFLKNTEARVRAAVEHAVR